MEEAKRTTILGKSGAQRNSVPLPLKLEAVKDQVIKSLGLIAAIAVWAVIAELGVFSPALLPAPLDVFLTGVAMLQNGVLIDHTLSSLSRVLLGFLLAVCIAVPAGLVMGLWGNFRKAVDPVIEVLRPIPPIAIIPIAILWFGIGESSKIFIITYAAFFPIVLNVMGGIHQVDPVHLKAARTLGANGLQTFYYVTLRSAIPNIIIGMRSGVSMAFISLVAAELIASNAGLGFLIQEARTLFKTDEVMVGMITIGLVGYGINRLLLAAEKRLVNWK